MRGNGRTSQHQRLITGLPSRVTLQAVQLRRTVGRRDRAFSQSPRLSTPRLHWIRHAKRNHTDCAQVRESNLHRFFHACGFPLMSVAQILAAADAIQYIQKHYAANSGQHCRYRQGWRFIHSCERYRDHLPPADEDARIAKMKDWRTHLAHKAQHAVDLDMARWWR